MYIEGKRRQFLRAGVVLGLFVLLAPALAYAQYSSPNFKVDEVFIGGGSVQDSCSTTYCSNQSAGASAVGDTSSTNYRAQSGSQTSGSPTLDFSVSNTTIDFGDLSDTATSAASSNFTVSTYLSSGYVVKVYGPPPSTGTISVHVLDALATPSPSSPGTEQFGINLVSNTTPGIGANPVQVPSSAFAYGVASAGYNTPDQYKYVDGDTIAESATSSGETDYTVSIIANINKVSTPGGLYRGQLVLQVIATF